MANASGHAPVRRLAVALVGVLFLALPALPASTGVPAAHAASAEPAGLAAYDSGLHERDCDLLGREFTRGRGCARNECADGAVLWRKTFGAEACALRAAKHGYGFVATVDSRQCRALHRRWIAEVNYCASEPDRSTGVLYNAPQCAGAASVYVLLEETEGYYDECLTLDRARELTELGASDGSALAAEVSRRSAVQCPHRPGHAFVDGECVADAAHPAGGGVVMIGDSLTWRGSDELTRLRPSFVLDGEPARRPTELASRLAFFRSLHGQPDGLVIELGSVPAKRFGRQDLARVARSVPRKTRVMFVLPYYEVRSHPVVVTPQSRKVARWMRDLARSRDESCVADWPAYVRAHPGVLQDGVHTTHYAEGQWAHWVSREWAHC
jgi:hypothetical protein